jgi:ankyrin repeat protein
MGISDRLSWFVKSAADRELLQALQYNAPDWVFALLAQGANAKLRNLRGQTLLFQAVDRWKDPAIIEELLARGADPRLRDNYGQTPLHLAAVFGSEAHLRILLDGGAEIDARNRYGSTPLHEASGFDHFKEATFLVSRGADVAARDRHGLTPLDHHLQRCRLEPQEPWERLLGGFMTARVLEVQGNSLKVQVVSVHSKYPEVEQQARERGALILPCGYLDDVPEPGDILRCAKGLALGQEKIWHAMHRRDLDIERER